LALDIQPSRRSEYIDWNAKSELFGFIQRLGEKLSESNLRTAFTDSSFIKQEEEKREQMGVSDVPLDMEDNSALAVAGHEAMSPFIKAYLRHFLPKLPEEGIGAVHDFVLSNEHLSVMSQTLGTTDIIFRSEYTPSDKTLANTLKAVVGAILKEHGSKRMERFVIDLILTYLQDKDIFEIWDIPDSKATLNHILANESLPPFEPRLVRDTGRNTIQACFMVGLYVNQRHIGTGSGETLEVAEEMAAYDALRKLFGIRPAEVVYEFGPRAYDMDFSPSNKEHMTLINWRSHPSSDEQKSRKSAN
jgi:large subunit ribosomal protein L44